MNLAFSYSGGRLAGLVPGAVPAIPLLRYSIAH